MRLGLVSLLLACLIGMAVSTYIGNDWPDISGGGLGTRGERWRRWGGGWKRKRSILSSSAQETLAEVFNVLDEDGDGFIDMDELTDDFGTVLKELKDTQSLVAQSDDNKDGRIDFDEFMKELGPFNGGV